MRHCQKETGCETRCKDWSATCGEDKSNLVVTVLIEETEQCLGFRPTVPSALGIDNEDLFHSRHFDISYCSRNNTGVIHNINNEALHLGERVQGPVLYMSAH